MCAAGQRCAATQQMGVQVALATLEQQPEAAGLCVPCDVGQYCPEGTIMASNSSRLATLQVSSAHV